MLCICLLVISRLLAQRNSFCLSVIVSGLFSDVELLSSEEQMVETLGSDRVVLDFFVCENLLFNELSHVFARHFVVVKVVYELEHFLGTLDRG